MLSEVPDSSECLLGEVVFESLIDQVARDLAKPKIEVWGNLRVPKPNILTGTVVAIAGSQPSNL
jgi:hypothetical protein